MKTLTPQDIADLGPCEQYAHHFFECEEGKPARVRHVPMPHLLALFGERTEVSLVEAVSDPRVPSLDRKWLAERLTQKLVYDKGRLDVMPPEFPAGGGHSQDMDNCPACDAWALEVGEFLQGLPEETK